MDKAIKGYLLRANSQSCTELKVAMDTKASRVAPALLLLALLAGCWLPAAGKRLRLGNCAITVHVHELRHNFNEMRQNVVKQDQQIGVRFLTKQTMKDIQLSESCCFLKHLLRFYVERVFSSYTTTASQHRKSTSNLANSFLSIKRDLRQCVSIATLLPANITEHMAQSQ
ncbi:hypothetical protein Z043_119448 [Scleropages formosus]|uniref:Interleukin-20 n=1 Tax=Scleropages formosus TaxID=113540 RepID=A0A0P7Y968_SCLFO|nr:hypothetical protein Z043_119448 [Scleropages formosus]